MKRTITFCVSALAVAELAHGAGYFLPNQDPLATAKGNAWVATADGPAAVYYNPAGLTQLEGQEMQVGLYSIQLGTHANIGGGRWRNEAEWQFAPSIFAGGPINERLSWGFGIYAPFGMGNNWGYGTPFQTLVTETYLSHMAGTGALSYQVNDCLSIGAAVTLNYQDFTQEQALAPVGFNYLRFEGDGCALSGSLGMRWQPSEKHSFGLVWASETSTTLKGDVSSNIASLNGKGRFDFMTPQRAAAGYSFRPAPGWNIEANIEWLDWDSLNTLVLTSSTVGAIPAVFNWKSTFIYEIGVSYMTPDGWVFAVGYDYNESAMPDATYTPGVADADIQYLNLGLGRDLEQWAWFLGYQFGYANRAVTASQVGTNGKYESRHHAVTMSLKHRF